MLAVNTQFLLKILHKFNVTRSAANVVTIQRQIRLFSLIKPLLLMSPTLLFQRQCKRQSSENKFIRVVTGDKHLQNLLKTSANSAEKIKM